MKQITAILELGKDGYGVSFQEIDNVFAFGETVEKAKQEANEALKFYIDVLNEDNKNLPEILKGKYEIKFQFDVPALLKYISGTVTQKAISRETGIHETQLTHYSKGLKKPRKKQQERIINGLHKIGRELLAVY